MQSRLSEIRNQAPPRNLGFRREQAFSLWALNKRPWECGYSSPLSFSSNLALETPHSN